MNTPKNTLYGVGDDEHVYLLDDLISDLISDECPVVEIQEYTINKHTSDRWCSFIGDFLINGDECGKAQCKEYLPSNGFRGKCIYKNFVYSQTGKKFLLTKSSLEEIKI